MDRAATETRIRRDYLVALENDDFSFQAPVYVKGFLVNYARYLRLDPDPLVMEFEDRIGGESNEALVLAEQNQAWTKAIRVTSAWWPLAVTAVALLILTTAALWTR
jgi:cytoskeletal protein RodZ